MISIADAVARAVLSGTKDYAAIKKKQERDQRQADRLTERYRQGRSCRLTIKDAAWVAIPAAYNKASGGGKYPANARQVMYAARPSIQEQTDQTLDDAYFTQTLLPEYMREHSDTTDDWDVVYDARGHLWEPHTGREIGLGTLEVRRYLNKLEDTVSLDIDLPDLKTAFPTCGPANRYQTVLYIEKEGFLPLLRQAGFEERYDLAIMSSKGMGTTAARTLVERLSAATTILVLHDFDKSGFSIVGTLTRDTRRYQYETDPRVVDLGLRLADVVQWKLQAEAVAYTSDPRENLELNGATLKEVEFLRGDRTHEWSRRQHYAGKRVELNAFTSDQFVKWLESKLKQQKIKKLVPDEETLERVYRRAASIHRYQEIIDRAKEEVTSYAEALKVPKGLKKSLMKRLSRNPSLAWDQALVAFLPHR
jgi:hypothetical protein